jgi:Fe-Mn family superoxide dismutase
MPTRRQLLEGSALVAGGLMLPKLLRADPPAAKDASAAPAAATGPFTLPPLPYAADALEPFLDAETMRLHHDKHHATYVTKLNEAVAGHAALQGKSLDELLKNLAAVPETARTAVRNHGGGHANHTLFWASLRPADAAKKERALAPGAFASAVAGTFGSLAALEEALGKAAGGVFGSGWGWLVRGADGKLAIETTPNQDTPLMAGRTPLLGLDVWEHAYYLKYQNRRADYLAAIWNVVDWKAVAGRFDEA